MLKLRKKDGGITVAENKEHAREIENQHVVSNGRLLSYAIGLAGQNMTYGYISSWLFYFMTSVIKINSVTVGLITSVTRAWDSVNDPLVGALVDKHRFKNGNKLRPILIITPPFVGVLSALMFINLPVGQTAKIAIIFAAYLLWDLFYSFQDVGLWGMIAASSPYSHERAKVSQWVSIGAGAGSTIVMVFQVLRSMLTDRGMSDTAVFALFGIIFGLGGELISMSAHRMKETVETPKSEESIIEAIFVLRHNKTLLLISLARFCKDVFATLLPAAYFFESRESFNFGFAAFDGQTSQVVFTVLSGAIGALAMFFATKVSDRLGGMKRLLILAQSSSVILRLISYFIGVNSVPRLYAVILLVSIMSVPVNMMDIAHRSLTSDSIDEVEYKTGKRTEGISFSVQNFISKLSSAAGLLINGFVLKWLKYDNSLKNFQQGALFMKWQWPIYMAGPIIGNVLYLIVISFVNDDKEKKEKIEAELKLRRESAKEKVAEINA